VHRGLPSCPHTSVSYFVRDRHITHPGLSFGNDHHLRRKIAATFAPRASGNTGKNPAVRGSLLYDIFIWQAYLSAAFGGLLAFNVLFPSTEPDIWRLMGMWSIWMLTIPSLRARDCRQEEKDALDLLFLAMPIMNILLPFIWKSFAFVWAMDFALTISVYRYKKASLNPWD